MPIRFGGSRSLCIENGPRRCRISEKVFCACDKIIWPKSGFDLYPNFPELLQEKNQPRKALKNHWKSQSKKLSKHFLFDPPHPSRADDGGCRLRRTTGLASGPVGSTKPGSTEYKKKEKQHHCRFEHERCQEKSLRHFVWCCIHWSLDFLSHQHHHK